MTEVDLTTEEARLVAVSRAIKEFDTDALISLDDVGDALGALEAVFKMDEKEKDLKADGMKVFLLGFVGGLAASRMQQIVAEHTAREYYEHPQYTPPPDEEVEGTQFVGGPSGGVAVGQGEDPSLVTQTGPRPNEEK